MSDIPVEPLLKLIENRFNLHIEGSIDHLREVHRHYSDKREMILRKYGEANSLVNEDYAKAVMISEAARMMILREILPRPKTKKNKDKR